MVAPVGLIEGFFGPEYPWQFRLELASHMKQWGGDFYLYAPKRDSYLRKSWDKKHPHETSENLKSLRAEFQKQEVGFGVGLSPFGLNDGWNVSIKNQLKHKCRELRELNLDYLGLFFDDMKSHPHLLKNQMKAVDIVASELDCRILFCPTYYCFDPILEKVFGPMPKSYLTDLAIHLDSSIDIMWTGPKVISPEIPPDHLDEVSNLLRRPPFIWDNVFANDGPRQCKFLKLKPLSGRTSHSLKFSSGWALNPMNQPYLSLLAFVSSLKVLKSDHSPLTSFTQTLSDLAGRDFTTWWSNHGGAFTEQGFDQIDKNALLQSIMHLQGPYFNDVRDFLLGKYAVGPECLTD